MSAIVTRAILSRLSPDEAAALWMVNRDAGHPVEAGLFDEWLDENDANREAWELLADDWALFDLPDEPEFAGLRERALADRASTAHRWRMPGFAVAAAAVAIVGGTVAMRISGLETTPPVVTTIATIEASYATTKHARQVSLPDGTQMTLAPNTHIRIAFSSGKRAVALERGKALFVVTHDAAHPFTVAVQDRVVTDIGTRFDVSSDEDRLRVALYEGRVEIGEPSRNLVLTPGQQYVASSGQPGSVTLIALGDDGANAPELVQFDEVRLGDAIRQVNQGSAVQIVIRDPAVADLRVSGRFRLHDAGRFARAVVALLPIRSTKVGGTIELRARR